MDKVIIAAAGAAEKNLEALKGMMEGLPSNVCLCFVGDGPSRPDLAKRFEGLPVYFTVRLYCLIVRCHSSGREGGSIYLLGSLTSCKVFPCRNLSHRA